jgi:hypothetical protein
MLVSKAKSLPIEWGTLSGVCTMAAIAISCPAVKMQKNIFVL